MHRLLLVALVAFVCGGAASATRTAVTPPLIGANYSHYRNLNCSLDDTGIISHYHERGVRRQVQGQLGAMRAAGIETLRLLLWHMTDASEQRWGVVSSAGGRLADPVHSNLIRYLRDVRAAGFERLTLSLAPMWTNSPYGQPDNVDDRSKLEENWSLIRFVRPLLKSYGPPSTHIDLINEAPPAQWQSPGEIEQTREYITTIWTRYVDSFGGDDAGFSSIGGGGPADAAERLQNLLDALRASGRPLPRWFDVHPPYSYDEALAVLRAVDQTLAANGVSQPLIIGEEAYNDDSVARAIAEFMRMSSRPVAEVLEWPLTAGRPCRDMSVSAPYRADAYLTIVKNMPVPSPTPDPLPLPPVRTIYASVGPGRAISLKTETGKPVVALASGPYRIAVSDRSAVDNFHLTGPDIDKKTGLKFRGKIVWKVDIGGAVPYGSRYSFSSDRTGARLRRAFRIA